MSLRMIADVLKARDISTHCPLCGRAFSRLSSDEEHIFPKWLLHKHDLWNRRLNIPNFIGKPYKSVKIQVCTRCNGKRFGAVETRLAPLFASSDSLASIRDVEDDVLAIWLGKIFWLLIRKSHSVVDFRTRDSSNPDRIIPADLLPGTLFLGMFERTFATGKGMVSCFSADPPIPELFYHAPYSLYRFKIDTRDNRFESFDFFDNPLTLGLGFRSGNLGVVCLFDGGLHKRFRQPWYKFLLREALHPQQFAETTARMIYDQTVLHESAYEVTYYWNQHLKAVIAQTHTPRHFNPYLEKNHDPTRLAGLIARLSAHNPAQILGPNGSIITCLHDVNGGFLRFAVTEAELAAARADPNQIIFGPTNIDWRVKENKI